MVKGKKTKKKVPGVYSPLIPVFIILATLVTGMIVSNASSNTTFKKKTKTKNDSVITSIYINSDNTANHIDNIKNNLLQGHIELNKTKNSMLVATINVKNIYDYPIVFEGLTFNENDNTLYSNNEILSLAEIMDTGTIIEPSKEDTLDLVFKYKGDASLNENTLDFYINLVFKNDTLILLDNNEKIYVPYGENIPNINIPLRENRIFLGYFDRDNNMYFDENGNTKIETTEERKIELFSKWR